MGKAIPAGYRWGCDSRSDNTIISVTFASKNGLTEPPSLEYCRLHFEAVAPPDLNVIAIYCTSLDPATLSPCIVQTVPTKSKFRDWYTPFEHAVAPLLR